MILNEYGDNVRPYKSHVGLVHLYDPQADDMIQMVLVHETCEGFVDRLHVTPTHNAFHCRSCGLRFLYPKEIETWGQLETWLNIHVAPHKKE